jgi:hypothetical protein
MYAFPRFYLNRQQVIVFPVVIDARNRRYDLADRRYSKVNGSLANIVDLSFMSPETFDAPVLKPNHKSATLRISESDESGPKFFRGRFTAFAVKPLVFAKGEELGADFIWRRGQRGIDRVGRHLSTRNFFMYTL